MRGNNIYMSMLLGLLVLITSCDDNKDEFLSDFDTIFYFLNSGEQNLTLYKTGENTDYAVTINKQEVILVGRNGFCCCFR